MLRRVLIGLAVLIVAVFAFVGYNTYSSRRPEAGSDVYFGAAPRSNIGARGTSTGPQLPAPALTNDPSAAQESTPEVTAGGAATASGLAPPSSDSIAPDPPNGAKFGSSGHYQVYRQGDLTWRLNTDTGETCILFATDEEWHKPKVYQAGCRGRP